MRRRQTYQAARHTSKRRSPARTRQGGAFDGSRTADATPGYLSQVEGVLSMRGFRAGDVGGSLASRPARPSTVDTRGGGAGNAQREVKRRAGYRSPTVRRSATRETT